MNTTPASGRNLGATIRVDAGGTALVDLASGGRAWGFAELDALVDAAAAAMTWPRGSRVGLLGQNSAAFVVTLEPGDALFLPSMWWHHVEGLDGLNMLVNYWWRSTPQFMGSPINVMKHALLGLRDMPPEQRRAWRHIFDYYVFDPSEDAVAHIPAHSRGMLSTMDDKAARRLRADLLNQLNR